uniref:C-type lectin domain-containing protein n=1 Tax=Sinocyclocheilus grahami TaxID=75366 RepID=A0A672QHS6_SINGR
FPMPTVCMCCPMPQSCMGSHCVKYFKKPLNFTDAEFSCMKKHPGAHLVSVHSSKHNDYLLCIVKKFNPNNLRIWVGGFELFNVKILFVRLVNFFGIDGSIWIGRWNDKSCFVKKNYICPFKQ